MNEEIQELLESAIYKEIASEALYQNYSKLTDDQGASELMLELAEEEKKHAGWLTSLKDKGGVGKWHNKRVSDLKISDHLTVADNIEGAGLQDTLIFSIKKEQLSIDFYSRMTGMLKTHVAKNLCLKLVNEEIRHKVKLEILYDKLFLGED
jgi:rubrerythrin